MGLMEKIPVLRNSRLLLKYAEYLKASGFMVDALLWIIVSLALGIGLGFAASGIDSRLGLVVFLVAADLAIGLPYLRAVKKIEGMESGLVDALRQMSDTLKSGGTYEYSLREIAQSSQGPLKEEMRRVLRKLEEGENFENSLRTLSEDIDSRTVKRVVTIIIDSVKSGAPLADVLEEIAGDVRASQRIDRERKSRTLMQAMFLVAAAAFVAPAIFGFVSTIISVLFAASAGTASSESVEAASAAGQAIYTLIQVYIVLMVMATSAMISLMREGRLSKAALYFPAFLFAAFVCFSLSETASSILFGGLA